MGTSSPSGKTYRQMNPPPRWSAHGSVGPRSPMSAMAWLRSSPPGRSSRWIAREVPVEAGAADVLHHADARDLVERRLRAERAVVVLADRGVGAPGQAREPLARERELVRADGDPDARSRRSARRRARRARPSRSRRRGTARRRRGRASGRRGRASRAARPPGALPRPRSTRTSRPSPRRGTAGRSRRRRRSGDGPRRGRARRCGDGHGSAPRAARRGLSRARGAPAPRAPGRRARGARPAPSSAPPPR